MFDYGADLGDLRALVLVAGQIVGVGDLSADFCWAASHERPPGGSIPAAHQRMGRTATLKFYDPRGQPRPVLRVLPGQLSVGWIRPADRIGQ
jgi:hypothetical protein